MVRPSHRRIHLNRLSQEPGPALSAPNADGYVVYDGEIVDPRTPH
jgi:hypothetical protein